MSDYTPGAEKEAWRALIPACADAISGFYTPSETIGDLAEVLAARVLSVAFQHRESLTTQPPGGAS